MFGYLDIVRDRLEAADGLDYNHLTFEEKQAVQALVEAGEARFATRAGRQWVERHSPSLLKRLVTMGAYA